MDNNNKLQRDFKGIWIPKEIWLNKDLKLNEKVFLVEIDSLDNEKGCFASNEYFANFFDLSKNRCSEIIKSLEKKGYIKIDYTYRENTKEIDKRIIKCIRNIDRVFEKPTEVFGKSGDTPSENTEDNNTLINNTNNNKDIYISTSEFIKQVITEWNLLGLSEIKIIRGKRLGHVNARLEEFTEEEFITAIRSISESDFLKGKNKDNWTISFDWFIKPNNFLKVVEGNYKNKTKPVINNDQKIKEFLGGF